MSWVNCNKCGCPKAACRTDGKAPRWDCARGEDTDGFGMCMSIRCDLMDKALRRLACPDAFDERGFIKPGRLIDVLEARDNAIRSAAALSGPIIAKSSD